MISFKTENGQVELQLDGSGLDITAEVMMMVHTVYEAFKERDEDVAEMFKEAFLENAENIFDSDQEREAKVNKAKKHIGRTVLALMLKELLSEEGEGENDTKHLSN